MRRSPTKTIEGFRITSGPMSTDKSCGANGAFAIPYAGELLRIIASDGSEWAKSGLPGQAWEHVSVSLADRCPTWEEMDYVKCIFWSDDETVLQFHVPRSDHINHHPHCLHLWRPKVSRIPLPPGETVGPKGDTHAT